ncbi:hypothetical protein [Chroococcidiopsis sp [FACHB-1243]]|nr:hypothetical protein [Chroococcidiopsis sp. [FACHB-1243]]
MKHELVSHKKLQDTLSHRRFKVKSVVREQGAVKKGCGVWEIGSW